MPRRHLVGEFLQRAARLFFVQFGRHTPPVCSLVIVMGAGAYDERSAGRGSLDDAL